MSLNEEDIIYGLEEDNFTATWYSIVGYGIFLNVPLIDEDNNGQYSIVFTSDEHILHYSNPDIYYHGKPTGTVSANNAALFRNTACEVAAFDPVQELSVFVSQSGCIPFTLQANITEPDSVLPGQPPYTVTWLWNTTGVFSNNQYSLLGYGETLQLTSHPQCPPYFVKCIVYSETDHVAVSRVYKVKKLPLTCNCSTTSPGGGERQAGLELPTGSGLTVFPNPNTESSFYLNCGEASGTMSEAVVINTSGQLVSAQKIPFSQDGIGMLRATNLGKGIYFLHLRTPDNQSYYQKLIIL
ncbi:MAG: T9SS type A sorting domain-containing protein [Lewinellaceae bacterium]|nr:T9SS type A sorting domain-containing protein [Lewinellaceae bacterium]